MNIDIITVGNIKENYLTQAINEYLKRLNYYLYSGHEKLNFHMSNIW